MADDPTTTAAYELADFHPETGHRHHCENPASCDCAAWLYALAQHAEEALWSIRAGTTAGTNPTTSGAAPAASTTGHPSAPSTPKADPSARTASPGNPGEFITEPTTAAWKRPQALPDGRVVEWVWGEDGGEALDVGPGHRRINVTVTVDGQAVTIPVVLTPEQIEEALRNGT